MYNHTNNYNYDYIQKDIIQVKDYDTYKVILTKDKQYTAKTIILATGTTQKQLNIINEEYYIGKGISFCAVCDGSLYKDKIITVIGGGNSALEEALYLAEFASKLYIIIRRDEFRAEQTIQDKVLNHPKINIIKSMIPKEVIGDKEKLTSLILENTKTKETINHITDAIFPFIGSLPSSIFINDLKLDEKKYIITNEYMETNIKGIYAAGDCISKYLRQVITAANDGAIAAQSIFSYIKDNL